MRVHNVADMTVVLNQHDAVLLLPGNGLDGMTTLFMVKLKVNRSVYWFPSKSRRLRLVKDGAKGFSDDDMT